MQNLSVQSVTQFSATLDNVPGSIAKVSGALAASGVSVVGFSQMPESGGRVRFVVDQPAAAQKVFAAANVVVSEEEILSVVCPQDRAGVMAAFSKALADAGVNIEGIYYSSAGAKSETVVYIQTKKADVAKATEVIKAL
ncbi:MAG: ACT domain-containing protein [Patescibacteria group bacterium]